MRQTLVLALAGLVIGAACTAGGPSSTPSTLPSTGQHDPVTITLWTGWSGREFKALQKILDGFHAKYPWITVKATPGIDDDAKIIAAIRGGTPPDAVSSFRPDYVGQYCSTGGFQDLGPYLTQSNIDTSIFPPSILSYVQYKGETCALPFLTDVFGLYYNKKMLEQAGYSGPPKTMSELAAMAKKLTVRNPDGSIKVAGFVPVIGNFYENDIARFALGWNATYFDAQGKSTYGTDPAWASLFRWQKSLIDFYGSSDITKFVAGVAGNEWDPGNAFETQKVAMILDGEWRTAFLADEAPDVQYGTAPFPAADDHREMYGAGVVGGTIVGIPRGSKHPAEAWALISYLATDTPTLVEFANLLRNVPSTIESLQSPDLDLGATFDPFLSVFTNPKSGYPPETESGVPEIDLGNEFAQKWQAGKVADLEAGLRDLAKQVDDQISLGG